VRLSPIAHLFLPPGSPFPFPLLVRLSAKTAGKKIDSEAVPPLFLLGLLMPNRMEDLPVRTDCSCTTPAFAVFFFPSSYPPTRSGKRASVRTGPIPHPCSFIWRDLFSSSYSSVLPERVVTRRRRMFFLPPPFRSRGLFPSPVFFARTQAHLKRKNVQAYPLLRVLSVELYQLRTKVMNDREGGKWFSASRSGLLFPPPPFPLRCGDGG